jgi:hypothetical protein
MRYTRSSLSLSLALLGLSLLHACEGGDESSDPVDAGGMGQQQTPSTTPPKNDAGSASADASTPAGPNTTQDAASTPATPQDGSTPTLDANSGGGDRDASTPAVDAAGGDAGSDAGPA